MMDFIIAPLVVGTVCAAVYGIFDLYVRRKERILIIEKIGDKLNAADPRVNLGNFSFPKFSGNLSFSALKIGCLLTGMGLGLLVGVFLDLVVTHEMSRYTDRHWMDILEIAYTAPVLLFGGLSLLVAFVIETGMKKKKEKQDPAL
jgi:hypothetical protein